MSLIRSSATIGAYTLISRVFGFIRDVLIATMVGANWQTDAFFVAFKLPNFFRRIFAEGAFNSAFVPMFAGMLTAEGREKAREFASQVYTILFLVLLFLTAIFMMIMPAFMHILAPGFLEYPEKFDLTVALTRITFPYLLFISLVSLLGGILNSFEKFAAVAATPILMNLCFIAGLLFFTSVVPTPAHALAVGVFIAGVAQFVWLVWFCKKLDMMPRFVRPTLSPDVKKMLKLLAPATFGAGVVQLNLVVDMIIGSHVESGVSYLYYADRLNELPLAVIGIAIGTAILPVLSKQAREGNIAAAAKTQNRALELTLLLALPAAMALIVIPEPLIMLLFEHGEFGPEQTAQVVPALIAFAAGLPAFVLIKVLAPGFFAQHDTKTPFKIAAFCVVLNLCLNLILIGPMRHVGLALATTISGWVNATAMAVILYRRGAWAPDQEIKSRLPRMLLACLVMALSLAGVMHITRGYFASGVMAETLVVSALVVTGLVAYGVAALVLRATDTARALDYINRTIR